jgi:hypothetical protein
MELDVMWAEGKPPHMVEIQPVISTRKPGEARTRLLACHTVISIFLPGKSAHSMQEDWSFSLGDPAPENSSLFDLSEIQLSWEILGDLVHQKIHVCTTQYISSESFPP